MLDTHWNFLDTGNSRKHFVCLQDFLQTSSRHIFKTSWLQFFVFQDVFKMSLQVFFKTLSSVIFVLKTSWRPTNSCWESFQFFYIPVILFDSVNRKDENYYSKVFLEKFNHNFLGGSIINFALEVSPEI